MRAAEFYMTQQQPDYVQTAEKWWLACVRCVKLLFLKLHIHVKSHYATRILCQEAIDRSNACKGIAAEVYSGWAAAEKYVLLYIRE